MRAIQWTGTELQLLDQRYLPHQENWLRLTNCQQVATAITDMVVRGAPAIAISAAYGLAMAIRDGEDRTTASAQLLAARPTAVNLRWALERLATVPADKVEEEARRIHAEDLQLNRSLGDHGAALLQGGVLTICNTGSLATAGYGTALGMIRSAFAQNPQLRVYAMETRPYLQGARLTAFECQKEGIPCTLITDGMAAALMATGQVDAVVAGCDRVARNGDTANKIGTYGIAVLAHYHHIPFYIAMPTPSLDRRCLSGQDIPIEERNPDEVRRIQNVAIAPADVQVWNPAFDITPASLITAYVTEKGIWNTPFPNQ